MKIRVYHGYYGCETGCCGHYFEIDDDREVFKFAHPYGDDVKEWATEMAQRVVRDKWPECYDSIDWSSIDISEVTDC